MSLKEYLKDHLLPIMLYCAVTIYIVILLLVFQVSSLLVTEIFIILMLSGGSIFYYNFRRIHHFFKAFTSRLASLDQKYLIHEIIEKPSFYEEKQFYSLLQDINKAMIDHVNTYRYTTEDYKEYIELWVHEVKIPLAAAKLIIENNKNEIDNNLIAELNRTENLVEQVLFYIRSGNLENDYCIKEINLDTIIKQVIANDRKSFIYKKIKLNLVNLNVVVKSDPKWLAFIIKQIISNSIKYSTKDATITIRTKFLNDSVCLRIEDNGIGISEQDRKRVFDKGFTGANGRKQYNSTGIGLYLCDKLCKKMHHQIQIESTIDKGTCVSIVFPNNSMTDIINQ